MRTRRARGLATLAILLAITMVASPAAGQVFLETDRPEIQVTPGEPTEVTVSLTNPTNRSYFVQARATGNLSADTTLEPDRFPLAPNADTSTVATITPERGTTFREGGLSLRFTLVDRDTADTIETRTRVHMTLDVPELYLGSFENPLPPPLDDGNGVFLLEVATWIAAGLFALVFLGTVVHRVAPKAGAEVQEHMAGLVRWPTFYLATVWGLNYSWRLLPDNTVLSVVDNLLEAGAIVVAAALAYRITSAGLYYYGRNVAGKTDTKVDDVLVPVLEKLGAALIVAVATFYTLQTLGVDLSFLVAGGLVAGLVISMAAQDTLSNLFSGVHLLVDRPFREGDEIQLETGEVCRVEEIGLRSTKLYHFANHREIIAPNNELATKRVVNMSYPDRNYRLVIPVGVSYDTDLEGVVKILHNVAMDTEAVLKGRTTGPRVFVKEFGESSIELELRAYVTDSRERNPAGTKIRQRIKDAFDEEGIEIPFPQRVVHLKGDGGERATKPGSGEAEITPPVDDGSET